MTKSFYNYQTVDFRGRRISYLVEIYENNEAHIYSTACSLKDQFSRYQGRDELKIKKEKGLVYVIPASDNPYKKAMNFIYNSGVFAYPSRNKDKRNKKKLVKRIINYIKYQFNKIIS